MKYSYNKVDNLDKYEQKIDESNKNFFNKENLNGENSVYPRR